ncbi:MAG: PDDEXK nuclease domain-containing protein [Melioribacteraceae bacterium]|nr:PDDEXK nuclease domain-containing protein [Melioribacteraceae bacterium]
MKEKLQNNKSILSEINSLIIESKQQVVTTVNSVMSMLYWRIGKRINDEILKEKKANYGEQIVSSLSKKLVSDYGNSFSEKNLRRMLQFSKVFPDEAIVVSLIRQLSWTHILAIIPIDDPLKREFYIEICKLEKWSVRTFRERIKSMLYERTAISKKPDVTIKNELQQLRDSELITQDLVFRDPYFLEFLNLKDTYSEKDLESAIIAELQRFIIELGNDFAFLARQKRITIDNRDYYIDLLFYHRRLKSLIVIDLKIGEFDAAYKGEMELYLGYLDKYENIDGENKPIGLILCTGKNPEHIELLHLQENNIKVADYFTILPTKEVLIDQLHKAIAIAKETLSKKF